jgi:hypothetical protein
MDLSNGQQAFFLSDRSIALARRDDLDWPVAILQWNPRTEQWVAAVNNSYRNTGYRYRVFKDLRKERVLLEEAPCLREDFLIERFNLLTLFLLHRQMPH